MKVGVREEVDDKVSEVEIMGQGKGVDWGDG